MADQDRTITPRLGLVGLDIADVPFGYPERVEFTEINRANLSILDSAILTSGSLTGSLFTNVNLVTQGNMILYVSTTGSDSNDGLASDRSFLTIQKAIDSVPHIVRHLVTIRVFRGTYAETLRDGHVYNDNGTFTGKLSIEAQDWDIATLTTGPSSGTLGTLPASGVSWPVTSTPGWTTNDLKGKFLRLTSGVQSGNWYPIAGNAANAIDITASSTQLNGATFEIVSPAVIITRTTGASMAVNVNNVPGGAANFAFALRRCRLNTGNFYGIYMGQGAVDAVECLFQGHTFAGAFVAAPGTAMALTRSYIQGSGALLGVIGGLCTALTLSGIVIDGGATGLQYNVTGMATKIVAGTGHTIIQNTTTAAFDSLHGPYSWETTATGRLIVRNNTGTGMRFRTGVHALLTQCELTGNTGHAVHFLGDATSIGGHNVVRFNSCQINNNGGDAIRVETTHTQVTLRTTTITGSGGVGVRLGGTSVPPTTFTGVWIESDVVMSGNVGGDLSINGVATASLAELRALPDKTILSSSVYNRIAGN